MNENLNLCEILKYCPKGTILYSIVYGNVEFVCVQEDCEYPIIIRTSRYGLNESVTSDGRAYKDYDGECTLFPSREQHDWSKFNVKKLKFDPTTLHPFDRVLAFSSTFGWICDVFSHYECENQDKAILSGGCLYSKVIPYNDDTKHLVGTTKEAPEFYRYWEE